MKPEDIKRCLDRVKFTSHAKEEMLGESFGGILEQEVFQAMMSGEIIEAYETDRPLRSYLVYGRTKKGRHLHVVCAPVLEENTLVIITVYEPDPKRWVDFRRRIK